MLEPEPIDFTEPEPTIMRKAAEGAFWPALRSAGWTDEQIHNGLRTYRAAVVDEIAAVVRDEGDRAYDDRGHRAAEALWVTADKVKAVALRAREERTYRTDVEH
ncbi:hypothetical protein NPS70_16335 [Streptomyces sp. C10-9-1]|uniref:hypothetical protein n=1 Tax=Streptomyces sp. C10-9-1 TaxID=1859285 RepID=UPI002112DCF3|nr:hypothetical protein [Streptomyces sp. C10-9-1]MCQ6554754.1 hypothetical protein [Streptomyces sp. C10-9-1]